MSSRPSHVMTKVFTIPLEVHLVLRLKCENLVQVMMIRIARVGIILRNVDQHVTALNLLSELALLKQETLLFSIKRNRGI